MRHRQRENSPTAPDILPPDDDDYTVTITNNGVYNDAAVGRMSPQSRRRAEFTIARLQRGGSLFGRARSTIGGLRPRFGGRDAAAAVSALSPTLAPSPTTSTVATVVPDKRLHKSPHRTLEFFTLWAGGRNKKAAAVTAAATATATTVGPLNSEKRILVDNTNRNPSTVVRNSCALVSADDSPKPHNVSQQQQQHKQQQQQRRSAENVATDYRQSTSNNNTSNHTVKSATANTTNAKANNATSSTTASTTATTDSTTSADR